MVKKMVSSQEKTVGGRYRLLMPIGKGGMSTVWLAMDTTLGKQWAVKEIKLTDDAKHRKLVVESLLAEANLLKSLDHAAIPRIVDLVDEDGVLYVVMDYIEGKTLSQVLKEGGPQSEDDVIDWAIQLCDVLDYLHHRTPALVYRDLKPSNVMLHADGTIRLIDFGITCEEGMLVDGAHVLGTKGFGAPEQYRPGSAIDRTADIYGLGATMYTLLTDIRPQHEVPVEPLRQIRLTLSRGIEAIVAKAMEHAKESRFQDAAQMAYALEHVRQSEDAYQGKLRRSWHTFVGLCMAALLCLAVGAGCLAGRAFALNSDFDYWMHIAEQTVDPEAARDAYAKAAEALPQDTRPYFGLLDLYRADGVFSQDEEAAFERILMPHLQELQRDGASWGRLSFEIGKTYWYYYDAGENPSGEFTRMRAASRWMRNAAGEKGFADQASAQVYAGIADFENAIVPRIAEGTDAGLYGPYFSELSELIASLETEGTDVMRLQGADLALDALRVYPRKFRADGVAKEEMDALAERAAALAKSVDTTSQTADEQKARILGNLEATKQAISDSFVDVGSAD